jgi:hypothetical protein
LLDGCLILSILCIWPHGLNDTFHLQQHIH